MGSLPLDLMSLLLLLNLPLTPLAMSLLGVQIMPLLSLPIPDIPRQLPRGSQTGGLSLIQRLGHQEQGTQKGNARQSGADMKNVKPAQSDGDVPATDATEDGAAGQAGREESHPPRPLMNKKHVAYYGGCYGFRHRRADALEDADDKD